MYPVLINVAKGISKADLVLKNARLVNVLSEEIYKTDIAIADGIICGLGSGYHGKKEIDLKGAYVCPSFIDGHVHLESSMMLPQEFAKAVLPIGTTSVFTDPHEIANVMGIDGIKFMKEYSQNIGLDVYFMLPSCVPATTFEDSGYKLKAKDLKKLMSDDRVRGLAEMMNYVGVVNGDKDVHDKLDMAKSYNKQIDGHAPMLTGKDLCAYIVSGIKSDHECTSVKEALEKMRSGLYIMIREGSAAKDLDTLLPILNINTRKCIFVTDDRHPSDLSEHINGMVRRAVKFGISPIKAIQCASLNTAEYFGINNLGAVAVGYRADMLVLDDLISFKPKYVIKNGDIIAKNGKMLVKKSSAKQKKINTHSVKIAPLKLSDFAIKVNSARVKTIEIIEHQLVTKSIVSEVKVKNGFAESNIDNDILKICVLERHHATGHIGKGFIKGVGLKSGAIASTVAHDSHNIMVIGTNDKDMFVAVKELVKSQGGKVIVKNGKVLSKLPLPIAGLMSDRSFDEVKKDCVNLSKSVKKLGSSLDDAFMTMGFLALPVIPELKITDKGLFDVNTFSFVTIEE